MIEHPSKPPSELSSEEKLDVADLSNRQSKLDNKVENVSKAPSLQQVSVAV